MCDRSRRTPRVSVSRPITALVRCVAVVLHPELRHSVQRVTQVCIRLYAEMYAKRISCSAIKSPVRCWQYRMQRIDATNA